MLDQIASAQSALTAAIAELSQTGGNSGPLAESHSQLAALSLLSLQLGTASRSALISLRGEVTAAVATASGTAQQAHAATASAAVDIAQTAAASRMQVDSVMRGMKDFDPYLQFGSKAEEEAYRKREDERQTYIAAEQAKGTPEGDLNASGAAVGQMADAKAHGAGDSPEFKRRWDALVESTERLRDQVRQSGGSTKEFDDHLRDDIRRILKSKGLTDSQIEAQLAAHPDNPLEAAKTLVAEQKVAINDKDMVVMANNAREYRDDADLSAQSVKAVESAPPVAIGSLSDAVSVLKSAGVVAHQPASEDAPAHGVSAQVAIGSVPSRSA